MFISDMFSWKVSERNHDIPDPLEKSPRYSGNHAARETNMGMKFYKIHPFSSSPSFVVLDVAHYPVNAIHTCITHVAMIINLVIRSKLEICSSRFGRRFKILCPTHVCR